MRATRKFLNKRTDVNGIQFDSAAEARRYAELLILERAGEIKALERQPRFVLSVNGQRICAYVGDFAYFTRDNRQVVEDVKSAFTAKLPVYRLKKKLLKAIEGVEIVEVMA
jgi:hypothetical protein